MRRILLLLLLSLLVIGGTAQAQDGVCTFSGTLDSLALYHAPLTHQSQIKDQLPGGVSYHVQAQQGEHYLIAFDDAYGGWVDRRSGALDGDCWAVPVDTTPLSAFPSICLFTAQREAILYSDASLTRAEGSIPANASFPAVEIGTTTHYLLLDHARGAWVIAQNGGLSGGCNLDAPQNQEAVALENARVWSAPDVRDGQWIASLVPGSIVSIIAGPVNGPIRLDSGATGPWYHIQQGRIQGWVWAARLSEVVSPPLANSVTARLNARLWSQPNVRSGEVLRALNPGAVVSITGGPVNGPVRFDTDATGLWYPAQVGALSGWIWAERLDFP